MYNAALVFKLEATLLINLLLGNGNCLWSLGEQLVASQSQPTCQLFFTIIALQQLPKVKYIWMLTLKLMITSHMNVHRYMTFHAKKLVDEIPSWQVNQILFLFTISILDFKEEICRSKSKTFFLQEPSTNSQFRWGYDHN